MGDETRSLPSVGGVRSRHGHMYTGGEGQCFNLMYDCVSE